MMNSCGSHILLMEPDPQLAQTLSQDLRTAGYYPVVTSTPASCLEEMERLQPALVVVDQTGTGISSKSRVDRASLDLCEHLRGTGTRIPLLLLIPQDDLDSRVACLDAGADDYFLKPYRSEAFLYLIQLYLQPQAQSGEYLRFETLSLDLLNRRAERNGRRIDLTMKEFELLKYLMEHPRQVLNREQILENVWGYDYVGESNVIEVYIRYLRLKVEEEGERRLIHTVRGVGYVLRET